MSDSATIQAALQYANAHRTDFLAGYKTLLSFPSIGADPAHSGDVRACAQWLVAELQRIGLEHCQLMETAGHPVVYADWLHAGDDQPTVLVYDHYDVQPVDPLDLWESDPFTADLRADRLYARGALDNKAGIWGNLKVLEALLAANGALPVNIKLLFEGEEESGSPSIADFLKQHQAHFSADVMLNCDSGVDPAHPKIAYAGRGIVGAEVHIVGPAADLHSGVYGGIVLNPLHVASQIIASFHDNTGRIAIPHFYDAVAAPDADERVRIEQGWSTETMRQLPQRDLRWGASIASIAERATAYPTLDVNGLWGGYQGPGGKTVIPSEAHFKVTMRIVPHQNPHEIAALFKQHVEQFASNQTDVTVTINDTGWYFQQMTDGHYFEAVKRAISSFSDVPPKLFRGGGSIPILGLFNRLTKMPIVEYGYGRGDNVHAPNEYIDLPTFYDALAGGIRLYHYLATS